MWRMAALSCHSRLAQRGQTDTAGIEAAIHATLTEPRLRTRDLGGKATTDDFTRSVIERLG